MAVNPRFSQPLPAAAKSLQLCLTLCNPIDGSPLGSSVPGILQARILEWVAIPFSRGSSQPRDRTQVSHTAGGFFFLSAEPQGKPKNTGVGRLSLLQQIFPTQELNRGLLQLQAILYQLSYQGSPVYPENITFHRLRVQSYKTIPYQAHPTLQIPTTSPGGEWL